MTRYARFEEIDGDLVLRVPTDVAAELGFTAGDVAAIGASGANLTVSPVDERVQRQLRIGREIMSANAGVLDALAK